VLGVPTSYGSREEGGRCCKLCELEDFGDPALKALIQEAFAHQTERLGPAFPFGREYRKYWEVAMSLRALRELGALGPQSEVLGVGAGAEATLFWLTNHVRRVFATDLYAPAEGWADQAPPGMLSDAGRFATCPWKPNRLVVQQMDAHELRYEDASFDGVFSSSAIEHFGDYEDVQTALGEIRRVLKPGGIAALSTEFRLDGPPPGLPGVLLFDEAELGSVLDADGWALVEPLDLDMSSATLVTVVDFEQAAADLEAGREWSVLPHIVLRSAVGMTWTSIHVALRKDA
jgi:SAM-dependent methyltransferase